MSEMSQRATDLHPKLTVILGAGASAGCSDGTEPTKNMWRPPTAESLFNLSQFEYHEIAERYPRVRTIVSLLGGPAQLEQRLRDLTSHTSSVIRTSLRHVAPFLSDLLAGCSANYTSGAPAGAYLRLATASLEEHPHSVAFVTLNYDTFLEDALRRLDRLEYGISGIDDYAQPRRRWMVIKIHGSVDWFAPMRGTQVSNSWYEAAERIEHASAETGVLIPRSGPKRGSYRSVIELRDPTSQSLVYPILAAPLAGKCADDLLCPAKHLESLKHFLGDCQKFLFIGTSGRDEDLLAILNKGALDPRCTHVVDCNDATVVAQRIHKIVPAITGESVTPLRMPFNVYVKSEYFATLLRG